jgi:hypothetical protein
MAVEVNEQDSITLTLSLKGPPKIFTTIRSDGKEKFVFLVQFGLILFIYIV